MKRIWFFLLIISLSAVLFSITQIIGYQQDRTQQAQYQQITIQENESFEFLTEYPNSIGYLEFSDRGFVVMQGEDNEYYLTHDVMGNENIFGAVFLDYRNEPKDRHLMLHGHSSYDDQMFTFLKNYLEEMYLVENPTFTFYLDAIQYECEIFAAYVFLPVDLSHYAFVDNSDEMGNYLNMLSGYDTIENVNRESKVITLSTCDMSNTQQRILIHATMNPI